MNSTRPLQVALVFLALVFPVWSGGVSATPLDDYVAAPDASYSYGPDPLTTYSGSGWTATLWPMTSQTWRSPEEVDRTVWEHQITIIVPDVVSYTKAMLFIAGGSNNGDIPPSPPGELTFIARGRIDRLLLGQIQDHGRSALAAPPAYDQGCGARHGHRPV